MKNLGKKIIASILVLGYILWEVSASHTRATALNNTGSLMKKVPWSIPYVIVSIIFYILLGNYLFSEVFKLAQKVE